MAVTIYDVAKAAGVGIGTVSRVINDSARVSPETRARVLAAIEELGYKPNPMARNLSRQRVRSIGVLLSFLTSPFQVAVLQGIEQVISKAGYELVVYSIESPERRDLVLENLLDGLRLDGVIAVSFAPGEHFLQRFRRYQIPVVVTDYHQEELPSVFVDNVRGGQMATQHLLGLGHRRIAYIQDHFQRPNGPQSNWPGQDRRQGYLRALEEAGVEADPALIVESRGHSRARGSAAMARLLDQPNPPTAVFAASDMLALGAMEQIHQRRLRVPEDVALVGFDDIELAAFAALTTIRQPMRQMGRLAAQALVQLLAKEPLPALAQELPLTLVVRGSCGAPRGSRSDLAHPENIHP